MPIERKLKAIMFTDIVNFSLIMGEDEDNTMLLLDKHNEISNKVFSKYKGKLIKQLGDGNFVEFNSSLDAVKTAKELQQQFKEYNKNVVEENQIHIRIGIHVGDVIEKNGDLFGDGVNVTSRITAFAEKGGVCITQEAYRTIQGQKDVYAISIGDYDLKNIVGNWNLYRIFDNRDEFQEWTESIHKQKRAQERKTKFYKIGFTSLTLIVLLIINVPIIKEIYIDYQNDKQLNYLYEKLSLILKEDNQLDSNDIQLIKNDDGVILSHSGSSAFPAGSTKLTDDAKIVMLKYVNIINSFDGYFEINTHTDSWVPSGSIKLKYATNAELAGIRGASIFSYLVQSGLDFNTGRVRASFWADRMPKYFGYLDKMATEEEIENANSTAELRAKNRRIDFYFHY
ncbi:MAG: adenylate/guanylate cyclase domain-containing protein [Candidatus Marinimicrobia bacterium]|jgi:class 3 adenylate cyclase/outer membrane protein OmpA-like peptidoglycan-associated protein|nr:adenylate/guanylate cyclase domain-containing protein [Candidatus Neomarinimicrobiota bacterium]